MERSLRGAPTVVLDGRPGGIELDRPDGATFTFEEASSGRWRVEYHGQSIAIVVPVDDDGGSDGGNACRLAQDANAPADLKRERHAPAIASNSEMTDIGDRYADVASHDAESGPQSRRPRRECVADETSGANEAMSARTQHQQQIYEEYEGREMARKVREIRNVCPTLDDEEAERALRIFDGNEDEAAEALTRL